MQERTCEFDDTKVATTVSGCVDVESGSESALKKAVSEVGPVSVVIDASHSSFQSYSGGTLAHRLIDKSCLIGSDDIIF